MIYSSNSILKINLSTIQDNYNLLKTFAKGAEVSSVVKANAYGLGADIISPALESSGCKHFFVATIDEALVLRKCLNLKSNIYILNGVFVDDAKELLANNLIPLLNNLKQIEIWQNLAINTQQKLPCILHIDIGMNRLAIADNEFTKLCSNLEIINMLEPLYILGHLSSSEQKNNPVNKLQLKLFNEKTKNFPSKIKKSLANSGSIFLGKEYHFDLVRPGGSLYGINPLIENENHLKNVVELNAPIIHIQELSKGKSVGYNETYIAPKDSKIATIPIGYADGYTQPINNLGVVYINNKPAKVIGLVSMDSTIIDVSDIPSKDIFLGQQVEIVGNNCCFDKLARVCNTNARQLLTMLGSRFKRVYNNK